MKPFTRYLLTKIAWYLLAFLAAAALNFFLPRLIPGNPVDQIVSGMGSGGTVSSASLQRIYATYIKEFGLDQPLIVQFGTYLNRLFHGDLGTSFANYPASVNSIVRAALPWSIALQLPAILIGWLIGNVLGAIAAYRGGIFDRTVFLGALGFSSIPYFSLAILLLYAFAVAWPILPSSGGYNFINSPAFTFGFFVDALQHYILPFLSLVLIVIGGQAVGMRSMAIYELGSDYVSYENSMGLGENRIIRGIFRNAMLPQITGLALAIGSLVGGALITEIVFSYPGIGTTLFTAIGQNDYPVIQGITILITLAVLGANFLVDLSYGFIDPRIRASQQGER